MRTVNAYGLLVLATASTVMSQGVTAVIAPPKPAPAGCSASYPGKFEITVVGTTAPKKIKRDPLELTLSGGILKDSLARIGYIASNYQFQFDGPPQAGSIYTAGFSVCNNGSLALGGSAIWYQCLSGGFYNLYDRWWAAQCSPIYINVIGAGAAGTTTTGKATLVTSAAQRGDGQVYATTENVVTQITDGQIQAPTATERSDGQVVVTTPAVVGQISDGQIQATLATDTAVTEKTGSGKTATGTTATGTAAVGDSSEAHAAGHSSTATPVTQISDGQPQSPTQSSKVVNAGSSATGVKPATVTTNAANALAGEGLAVAAGMAAVFALF